MFRIQVVVFFPDSLFHYSKLYYSTKADEMIIYKLYILSLKINTILVCFKKNPCANSYITLLGFTCGLLIGGKERQRKCAVHLAFITLHCDVAKESF